MTALLTICTVTPSGCRHPRRGGGRRRGILAALAAALALWAAPTHALDPERAITQYVVDRFYARDGLPQNSVHTIVQTRDGYLWFGTEEGLARFDGVGFKVFHRGNPSAFRSNYVVCMIEARQGGLWVGTLGGGLLRYQDGRFTRYDETHGLSSKMIRCLYEEPNGTLWIGTAGGGLNRMRGGRFQTYGRKDGLSHDFVRGIVPDGAGGLWLATQAGANHFRDGRVDRVLGPADGLSDPMVLSAYRDQKGRIWFGTKDGLDVLDNGTLMTFGHRLGMGNVSVFAVHEDRAGNLWVGSERGLSRFANGRVHTLTDAGGLSGNRVRSIQEDREGNLWVGAFGGGLTRLREGKLLTYTTREGLAHDDIGPVLQDPSGVIWVGTRGGGLCRFAPDGIRNYTTADGLPSNLIESLHLSRDGTLWIGTFDAGLVRYRDGRFHTLTRADGLSHEGIMTIRDGPDGDLWVGTNGGGLHRYRNGAFTVYTKADGLPHDLVRSLHFDRHGALWVSTFGGGLGRYQNGVFTTYTTRDGLSRDEVGRIYEDDEGTLWIPTLGGGVNRLKDGKFTSIRSHQGLYDDLVYGIAEDRSGNFWMTSNRGIFRVPRHEMNAVADGRAREVACTAFAEPDGMRNRECNGSSPAIWRALDGRMWVPTLGGVVVVNPERLPSNELAPPVRVERVVVDGRDAARTGPLRLQPGTQKLEFHFTALSYRVPTRVRFRYRLEGFEDDWVDAGALRAAYYTNLAPGHYRFRVIACNDDGVWNEAGATLGFRLLPHFWQTWWFKGACVVLVVALALWTHRRRTRLLKARAVMLQGLVDERTAAQEALTVTNHRLAEALENLRRAQDSLVEQERLRALGQMASGISHDFNNALAPILGFSDLLLRSDLTADREQSRRYLVNIHTAAKDAGNMVRRLREFYRGREEAEAFPLVRVDAVVEQAIALTQPKWKDQALAGNANVEVRAELGRTPLVPANESDLREALTNLVFNAVDALPNGGLITIATRAEDDHVAIEVRDDGVGMTEETRRRCLEPFFTTKGEQGTGLGLPMVYGLVQRHGGSLSIDSAPGQGTTIAMRLPLRGAAAGADAREDAGRLERALAVLVVDDEPAIVEFVSAALRADGHRVETAADGLEALERIKAATFDLIIADRAMPRMSGDQLAGAVRATRPDVRVLLLTGFGDAMITRGETPAGVDLVVGKPVTVASLRRAFVRLFPPDEARAA